jgi:tetratricopeptide (TPR) repeat protein
MSPQLPSHGPLPPDLAERIDSVCDRFEADWQAGSRPRLEDFLSQVEETERPALLRELLPVELAYRRRCGEPPTLEEYRQRLPRHVALVEGAFGCLSLTGQEALAQPDPRGHAGPAPAGSAGTHDRYPRGLTGSADGSPPADSATLPSSPALRAGRYTLMEEIARGGMGAVLRARDAELNRCLAVKVLREDYRGNTALERRFREEARITGQLQHPGIPPVHEVGVLSDGRPYFAMKLIEGRTLADLLEERPSPTHDLPRFLGIFEQVCQTLAYAHSRGVIHRDLKPANVMVGAFGEVQVMDWGLAKVLREDRCPETTAPAEASALTPARADASAATKTGMVLGTPAYMAPEQARGEVGRLNEHSDVFGLGAILCVILTGQPPYTGASKEDVHRQAEAGGLEAAFARLEGCGSDGKLVWLARVCLAAEPADRPPHAGAVAEAMAAYQAGVQQRLRQAEVDRARAEVQAGEERKRRRLAVALTALAVVLVAGLAGGVLLYERAEAKREWERALHLAERRRQLDLAFKEVDALHERALEHTPDADHWKTTLTAARAALGRAEALLAEEGGRADAALQRRVKEARGLLEGAERDRRLVARYEQILLDQAELNSEGSRWRLQEGYPKLREALRDYGLEVGVLPPARAAALVEGRPGAVRPHVVAVLQDCLRQAPREHARERDWVREVLDRGDPDRWRSAARRAVAAADWQTVRRLANAPAATRQPPAFTFWLIASLPGREKATRLALLRRAAERHPGDFWTNYQLGFELYKEVFPRAAYRPARAEELPTLSEAVRFYAVATALHPRNPVLYNTLGIALKARGDVAGAIAAYRRAIELDPRYVKAYNNLALALKARGDAAGAIAAFRRTLELDPTYAGAHTGLGDVLATQGKTDEAIAAYHRALKLDPKNAGAYANLGTALTVRGDVVGAAAVLRRALDIDPRYAPAHVNLGNLLVVQEKTGEAAAAYRRAVELDPGFAPAHYNLGGALHKQGQPAAAVAAYRRAIRLQPDFTPAHYNLGVALDDLGRLDEAIAAYRKALELDPKLSGAHVNLGADLLVKKDFAGAIAACRRAIELDPKIAGTYDNLGGALAGQGKGEEAVAAYRRAIELDPGYAKAHYNLGVVQAKQGRLAEAVAAFRQAIRLKPDLPNVHYNLGVALDMQGKPAEAEAAYREALRLRPGDPEAHYNLGVALGRQGNLALAEDSFRRAVRFRPDSPKAHVNLGLALYKQGRFREALDCLREGHRLAARLPGGPSADSAARIRQVERLAELDRDLPAFLSGKRKPPGPAEQTELASLCLHPARRLYLAAARFYTDAFAAEPALADDLVAAHRYRAACSAVLAGSGSAEDKPGPTAKERARLRRQALDWLRADLGGLAKQLQTGTPSARTGTIRTLSHWQTDPHLAGVRGTGGLAKLPEDESQLWERLWADVAALLKRAERP